MKKTNNKGFSLVELIIVIAILAILAGAIAPALIRFIDKSRRSNDVSSAKSIKTAIETALGNKKAYELMVPVQGANASIIVFDTSMTEAKVEAALPPAVLPLTATDRENVADDIWNSLSQKTPRLRFNKWGQTVYVATIDDTGSVKVFVADNAAAVTAAIAALVPTAAGYATDDTNAHAGTYWLLTPDVNDFYQ